MAILLEGDPFVVSIDFSSTYWGPHFPPRAMTYWAGHFPEGRREWVIPGVGPQAVATFSIVLDVEFRVKLKWRTDLMKSLNGKETRENINTYPQVSYSGVAQLVGKSVRVNRARLARYLAINKPFYLGMAQEEATLVADGDATTVYIQDGVKDWLNPGQRVIVIDSSRDETVEGVIQSVTGSNPIAVDIGKIVGDIGKKYGALMPAMPSYLANKQGFSRYPNPDTVEQWSIEAHATLFWYPKAALEASLPLEGLAHSGVLDGVVLRALETGPDGNDIRVRITGGSLTDAGEFEATGNDITLKVDGDTTTVGQLADLIYTANQLIQITGTWNPSDVIAASDDYFPYTNLSGGSDQTSATMGVGATVTMHGSRPIWDRHITLQGTAGDSVQSMSELIDYGGVVAPWSNASESDWGRQVSLYRQNRAEEQWVRKFLFTVKGMYKSFWLPTWRQDLSWLARASGTITIDNVDDDFFAWYPKRTNLQIIQVDGVVVRPIISLVTDNNDGTLTLSINDPDDSSPVTLTAGVFLISWLELVHFDKDEQEITYEGPGFRFEETARVVTQ